MSSRVLRAVAANSRTVSRSFGDAAGLTYPHSGEGLSEYDEIFRGRLATHKGVSNLRRVEAVPVQVLAIEILLLLVILVEE